jgi:DNA-binding cell septation regulator SpoVG
MNVILQKRRNKMPQITVVRLKKIEGKKVIAFADVSIDEIIVSGIRLMPDPKGDWIGLPQTSYDDKSGKKKYTPIVEVSEGLKKTLREKIIEEYKKT